MADLKVIAENLIDGKAPAAEEGVRQGMQIAGTPNFQMRFSEAMLFEPEAR